LVLGALAVGLSSFLVPGATASPGTTVTGTFAEEAVEIVAYRLEDGNLIVDFTATVEFTGGFTGTGTSVGTQVVHPTGLLTVQAVILCTCTVDDAVGGVVLRFTATGTASSTFFPEAKDGQFEVSGTEGLANLHGHGTFQQSVLEGTYEADIHFDPSM
jgi:hypothetical protein